MKAIVKCIARIPVEFDLPSGQVDGLQVHDLAVEKAKEYLMDADFEFSTSFGWEGKI